MFREFFDEYFEVHKESYTWLFFSNGLPVFQNIIWLISESNIWKSLIFIFTEIMDLFKKIVHNLDSISFYVNYGYFADNIHTYYLKKTFSCLSSYFHFFGGFSCNSILWEEDSITKIFPKCYFRKIFSYQKYNIIIISLYLMNNFHDSVYNHIISKFKFLVFTSIWSIHENQDDKLKKNFRNDNIRGISIRRYNPRYDSG